MLGVNDLVLSSDGTTIKLEVTDKKNATQTHSLESWVKEMVCIHSTLRLRTLKYWMETMKS